MINRTIKLLNLLKEQESVLLFGARGVGKTYLVRECVNSIQPKVTLYQHSSVISAEEATNLAQLHTSGSHNYLWFDLLNFETYRSLLSYPQLFSSQISESLKNFEFTTVVVDEVQKLGNLLDEAHRFLETYKTKINFVLLGSSARKLKRGGANLLAGRALSLKLHPFTHEEIEFEPLFHLRFGTIPAIIFKTENKESRLKSYVETYLREEVLQESLIRRVEGFAMFLEVAGQYHGKILNMSKVALAAGVSSKTIADYFQILQDTMLSWHLPGWNSSATKQLRLAPKFYFFDNGVANVLKGELSLELRPSTSRYGEAFECFVIQEAFRFKDNWGLELKFSYWLTNSGCEVDLIVSRGAGPALCGIEIKSASNPKEDAIKGLKSFHKDNPKSQLFCWCNTDKNYTIDGVLFCNWKTGLQLLKNF